MVSFLLIIAAYVIKVASSTNPHHLARRDQSSCCTALSTSLGDILFSPGNLPYKQSLASYFSQQEASLTPACILRPENVEHVSAAVKIISSIEPKDKTECNFAIRGGGYNPDVGSANIDQGVTIDLSSMKEIEVSSDETITSVGAGSLWGDIYLKLDPMKLTVGGGRYFPVGVVGLAIGGGISYFSPQKGFVCDNVQNFEVVLADGRIVNANANANQDLWVALRGGTNNFGIVTRVDITTFPQGGMWGGNILYDNSTALEQLGRFHDFGTATDYDEFASMYQVHGFRGGRNYVLNKLTYTKPEPNPPVFHPITDIKPQISNTLRISNHSDLSRDENAAKIFGTRNVFRTTTIINDLPLLLSILELWYDFTAQIASTPGLVASLLLDHLVVAITNKSSAQGGNSLGLAANQTPLVILLLSLSWTSPASDELVTRLGSEFLDRVSALARGKGLSHPFVNINYAARDQRPFPGYGEENLQQLRNVSLKYDPQGLFQIAVPGGFKLIEP